VANKSKVSLKDEAGRDRPPLRLLSLQSRPLKSTLWTTREDKSQCLLRHGDRKELFSWRTFFKASKGSQATTRTLVSIFSVPSSSCTYTVATREVHDKVWANRGQHGPAWATSAWRRRDKSALWPHRHRAGQYAHRHSTNSDFVVHSAYATFIEASTKQQSHFESQQRKRKKSKVQRSWTEWKRKVHSLVLTETLFVSLVAR